MDGKQDALHDEDALKKTVGSRKLRVSVTDISLLQPGITNDICSLNSTKKRGRGRPKKAAGDITPKKRGRPKGSKNSTVKAASGELLNGTSKTRRGRPKGSIKRKVTDSDDDSFSTSRKRAKGSSNKTLKSETEFSEDDDQTEMKAKITYGLQPAKRRGRPKGSRNKDFEYIVRVKNVGGRPQRTHNIPARLDNSLPQKMHRRGRPKKGKRGRPRKNPVPPGEELYQPRQWKPLGRPRKYPREEQDEGAASPETPRRGRGRPRKSESKKGAHLRRPDSGPKKPSASKNYDGPPRKRGRPKGSAKNKAQFSDCADERSNDAIESAPLEDELE